MEVRVSASERVLPASRQPVPVKSRGVSGDGSAEDAKRRRKRSVEEIEQAMAERSERLTANIDELLNRAKPSRVARDGLGRIGSTLTTSGGAPRLEVLGAIVGAAVVGGVLIWRARRRRG
jgi:hypothetical protein